MDSTASEFKLEGDGCFFCELALRNKPKFTQEELTDIIREIKGKYCECDD